MSCLAGFLLPPQTDQKKEEKETYIICLFALIWITIIESEDDKASTSKVSFRGVHQIA